MTQFGRPLWENADILVLVIVIEFWQFLTKTPLNVRIAVTVAGFYMVFRFFGAKREIDACASAAPMEKEGKRVFVDDPGVVLELAKLTGYDAVRRFTPYLGKWMTISGEYEGITQSLQGNAIHLSLLLNDGRRINLRFAAKHGEQLRGLQEGQRITAICQIQHCYFTFTPENCELVRAEPLRRTERSALAYIS